jgi:hypothetical protein
VCKLKDEYVENDYIFPTGKSIKKVQMTIYKYDDMASLLRVKLFNF